MRVVPIDLTELPPNLRAAHEYWLTLKGDRIAPTWQEFELLEIPPAALPTTMVIDIADPLENSRFRFWGSKMTDIHGVEMTGKCPYDLTPPELSKQLYEDHSLVVNEVREIAHNYSFEASAGYIHSHSVIRLPVSNDGAHVTQIVVVVDYSPEALEMITRNRGKMVRIISAPDSNG